MPKSPQQIVTERLCEKDLEDLRASGLTDQTIFQNELRTETDPVKLAEILNRLPERPPKQIKEFCRRGALLFPYRDLEGNVNCYARAKPHEPRTADGKPVKYESPVGSELRAYFPEASLPLLNDGKSPVYVTEGEKKALALAQLGLAAVGIGGIWCGCEPRQGNSGNKNNSPRLIPDLAAIPWKGRVAYIVFDYDAKPEKRQAAASARVRLGRALKAAGVRKVFPIELPPGPNGSKQGVDDFLVGHGRAAFAELRAQAAISVIKIIPPPVLGEEAYHGPLGEFVRAVGPYTEATEPGILAHLLCAVGAYVGRGTYLYHGNITHPAILNSVLVGPTSRGRKGTSLNFVKRLMETADPAWWRSQYLAGGLSTGEGLIAKLADRKKVTKNEATGEMDEEWELVDKRLYIVEEEFSKVLLQSRRDGNTLNHVLRQAFDGETLRVLTRANPLEAQDPCVCVTGHITQEELFDRFNHIEMANGFGNRFLWFAVRSDKRLPNAPTIPDWIFKKFVPVVKALGNCPRGAIPLADACKGLWDEIYDDLAEDKPGFVGAMLGRAPTYVCRLALAYYLLDPRSRRESEPGVGPEHLRAALAVWRYSEESVRMLFASRDEAAPADGLSALARKVLDLLKGGPLRKDQLNDHLSPQMKQKIDPTLEELLAAGLVVKDTLKGTGAGRPATVWGLAG
jgi:hypothetical protein